MGGKEEAAQVLAAKFAVIFPHLDERQRRLLAGAQARALGRGGNRFVARAAGVSVASVSRALNGHENVTDVTRKRIVEVAARLRYMPNDAARSLITRRTHTIGAILPDLHGEFFSELIRGIDLFRHGIRA